MPAVLQQNRGSKVDSKDALNPASSAYSSEQSFIICYQNPLSPCSFFFRFSWEITEPHEGPWVTEALPHRISCQDIN